MNQRLPHSICWNEYHSSNLYDYQRQYLLDRTYQKVFLSQRSHLMHLILTCILPPSFQLSSHYTPTQELKSTNSRHRASGPLWIFDIIWQVSLFLSFEPSTWIHQIVFFQCYYSITMDKPKKHYEGIYIDYNNTYGSSWFLFYTYLQSLFTSS